MFLVSLILSLSFIIHYQKHEETQVSLDLHREHYPSVNCLSNIASQLDICIRQP